MCVILIETVFLASFRSTRNSIIVIMEKACARSDETNARTCNAVECIHLFTYNHKNVSRREKAEKRGGKEERKGGKREREMRGGEMRERGEGALRLHCGNRYVRG